MFPLNKCDVFLNTLNSTVHLCSASLDSDVSCVGGFVAYIQFGGKHKKKKKYVTVFIIILGSLTCSRPRRTLVAMIPPNQLPELKWICEK